MTNATSSASPLEPWLAEWPTVRAGVDELVISLKRRQLVGSYETAKRVMMLLSQMLETVNWHTASEITDKVRSLGHMLTKAHPHELAIGNVVRRVLFIIREEHENASKTSPETDAKAPTSSSSRSYQSRSLGSILTPGTDADLSTPIADLKLARPAV